MATAAMGDLVAMLGQAAFPPDAVSYLGVTGVTGVTRKPSEPCLRLQL